MKNIALTDCPRDAIQGIKMFIPTEKKVAYIQTALDSGLFRAIDCGSFVSEKMVPQMADTADVLPQLIKPTNGTKLLVIVANQRGAERATKFDNVDYQGFPFSISEQFQLRNTNATREQALERVAEMVQLTKSANQQFVCYLSMAFGNPYQEEWSTDLVKKWVEKLAKLGIEYIALSDTVGQAQIPDIELLFSTLIPAFPDISFSSHFHALPNDWKTKVEAAYANGCTLFDGAINGFGGCPMANDNLVGNIPTEQLLRWKGIDNEYITSLISAFNQMIA